MQQTVVVALRSRPLFDKERLDGAARCLRYVDGQQVVLGKDRAFTYDFAFDETVSQEHVYQTCVSPLLRGIFEGYNAAVFAYGQTGAGKTYTMGSGVSTGGSDEGIIPRWSPSHRTPPDPGRS